jgi:hypothetical protein
MGLLSSGRSDDGETASGGSKEAKAILEGRIVFNSHQRRVRNIGIQKTSYRRLGINGLMGSENLAKICQSLAPFNNVGSALKLHNFGKSDTKLRNFEHSVRRYLSLCYRINAVMRPRALIR